MRTLSGCNREPRQGVQGSSRPVARQNQGSGANRVKTIGGHGFRSGIFRNPVSIRN